MKKTTWLLILLIFCSFNFLVADEIDEIRQAIKEKNANWTVAENWVSKLSPEQRRVLLGGIINPADAEMAPLLELPAAESLPPLFDWRNNNGNWVTPVKNQGNCGSCWDFSAVAQVEAWWKIYHANLDSMIDLSEQFILSCGGVGSCAGGSCNGALEFVKNFGVPSEACFPYYADDTVPCSSACANWMNEAVTIPGWGWATMDEAIVNNIKNAVYIHPLSTFLNVYTDLFNYSGGVYQYSWGQLEGGHLVLIVGWNDSEESWICKNSWGTGWGNSGYFRIKWGECDIGTWSPFIWDDVGSASAISVSPEQIDVSLSAGDTIISPIIVNNNGPNLLGYSVFDFGSKNLFHPDDFSTWDSLSWWCADTSIMGYPNNCLQYLETPIIDLSNTTSPILTWMGFWALEDTAGAGSFPPYDGWDGCNVWVSTDGGNNFTVAYPTYPPYDCTHMFSFSDPSGWNLGVTPGWGGTNHVWTPVEFDLSGFITDSVVIRFAFASDPAVCTLDNPSLIGFFVDEIQVADDTLIIFEDDANSLFNMQTMGYGYNPTDWIDIYNSVGEIAAFDSAIVDVKFDARILTQGDYFGTVRIISTDTILPLIEIPVFLQVMPPSGLHYSSDAYPDKFKLRQNYPNPFNPRTTIQFSIPKAEFVTLKIYNLLGQEVLTLVSDNLTPGEYKYTWDASHFASGVYFYKLEAGNFIQSKKLLLMK